MVRSKRLPARRARRTPKRILGTTRERVIAYHKANPDAGIADVAAVVGVTRQRVKQIGDELSIEFVTRHGTTPVMDVDPPVAPTREEIRQWRIEHGDISQAHLAALLGVAIDTVARWERGTRPPPALLRVALDGLGCAEA